MFTELTFKWFQLDWNYFETHIWELLKKNAICFINPKTLRTWYTVKAMKLESLIMHTNNQVPPWVIARGTCRMKERNFFLIEILTNSSLYTPTTAKDTLPGFNIGPNMLNTVFTFSLFLTGLTIFIAGWYLGAIINPIPTWFTQLVTPWV